MLPTNAAVQWKNSLEEKKEDKKDKKEDQNKGELKWQETKVKKEISIRI